MSLQNFMLHLRPDSNLELLYSLLSEGVVPTENMIRNCIAQGNTRLLEDLLKFADLEEIDLTALFYVSGYQDNKEKIQMTSSVLEVLSGFRVRVVMEFRGRKVSLIEYYLLHAGKNPSVKSLLRGAVRHCIPPNVETLLRIAYEDKSVDVERMCGLWKKYVQ